MADNASPRAPRLIVVPLVLGIIGAIALLIFAELGYQRLESAAQRVAAARSACARPRPWLETLRSSGTRRATRPCSIAEPPPKSPSGSRFVFMSR